MGATTVAAALSDFQAISQTVGTLKGGTVGADNLADELSSDLESQEAVVDKPVTAIVIGAGARGRTYADLSPRGLSTSGFSTHGFSVCGIPCSGVDSCGSSYISKIVLLILPLPSLCRCLTR